MSGEASVPRRRVLQQLGVGVGLLSGCLASRTGTRPATPPETRSEGERKPYTTADSGRTPVPLPEDRCEPDPRIEGDDPLLVEFDAREKDRCRGELLDGTERLDLWDTYDGTLEADDSRRFAGAQSARVTVAPEERRGWIHRRFVEPLDLSGYDLSVAVHPGEGGTRIRDLRLQLLAPDTKNRVDMWHPFGPLRGDWFRLDVGPTTVVGDPDLTGVRELRVQSWIGEGERARFHIDELRMTGKRERGKVMFTFDDSLLSQYTDAYPILDEYGYAGVVGVIPWLVGGEDRLSLDHMSELRDAGWDLTSHPQLDEPLWDLSRTEQEEVIRRTKRWLVDNGFEDGSRFIIYPYAKANGDTLELSSRHHYAGFTGGRCPSGKLTDPMTIGRVDGDDVEVTKRMVDFADEYRQLTVVMLHDVSDGGSGIDVDEFGDLVDHVHEADVDVITASEMWDAEVSRR